MNDSANPMNVLHRLQEHLDLEAEPVWSEANPDLLIDNEMLYGGKRFTVGLVEECQVISLAQVQHSPVYPEHSGLQLHLAIAVKENHRGHGLGERTLGYMLDELRTFLQSVGVKQFRLFALVDHDNLPSRTVIKRFIRNEPLEEVDGDTGLPALLYIDLIQC